MRILIAPSISYMPMIYRRLYMVLEYLLSRKGQHKLRCKLVGDGVLQVLW